MSYNYKASTSTVKCLLECYLQIDSGQETRNVSCRNLGDDLEETGHKGFVKHVPRVNTDEHNTEQS